MKKTTSPYIVVRNSRIHKKGVFAKKNIPADTKIIEYVGQKLTNKEADENEGVNKNGVFLFEINKRYSIDGDVPYNTAKYMNHSCDPNCETDVIKGRVWIMSMRNIKKGEELTYNYGFDLDEFQDYPCNCGAPNCIGYIVGDDYWEKAAKKIAALKKKRL